MVTNKKVTGTALPFPVGIAVGVLVSVGTTALLSAVLTWLVLSGKLNESAVGYASMGILLLSTALGSVLSAVKIKRRWLLVCELTGVLHFFVLLAATALFFGGEYHGVGITGALILTGSTGAGLMGLRRNGTYKKRCTKLKTC